MDYLTVKDVDLQDKVILMRVDFNVPLADDDSVSDDYRLRATLPTIKYVKEQGGKLILMSHLGRPGGRSVPELSLQPVAQHLSTLLNEEVKFSQQLIGDEVKKQVDNMDPGDILFLENTRFNKGETENSPDLSRELAEIADIFVNDAFGTAHRMHASTYGVAEYIPGVMGLLMQEELEYLTRLRSDWRRPYVAVLGGAKISDKLAVCRKLLNKVDALLLGGGLANTFLLCMGYAVGNSLIEPEMVPEVRSIIAEANRKDVDLLMPLDVIVASNIAPNSPREVVDTHDIPSDWSIVDIGPRTIERYKNKLADAKTVFWNGPMGIFEISDFARGTQQIAQAIASLDEVETVIGGGESVEAVKTLAASDRIDHISTAGGAALSFLAGKELPALGVLERAQKLRVPWVGGNWKMNTRSADAQELAEDIASNWEHSEPEVVLFPPHIFVESVRSEISGTPVAVGGQDCHWEDSGAYTGSISARMLRSAGARFVLVGHSECREYLGDDNERVREKLDTAQKAGLSTVLCVGESRNDRDAGNHRDRISQQLRVALQDGDDYPSRKLIIAYEPVWAIGSGLPAKLEDVEEMTSHIRTELEHIYDERKAQRIRIVYGGSVNPDNVSDFIALVDVDGVLIGGASLRPNAFIEILEDIRGNTTRISGEK